MSVPDQLRTPHGTIRFPAYIPVTTYGQKYPLDDLVRPYLHRLSPAVMVSYHYARQLTTRLPLPMLVDSGGFALLFKGARLRSRKGLGVIERGMGEQRELLHPKDVLELQESVADVAFTLDLPIPPGLPRREANRRIQLTVANAHWALENKRRPEMRLYGCVQGYDAESYRKCALELQARPFDGLAIGGLVPRARRVKEVVAIVDAVRDVAPDVPLHVFGLGKPGLVERLFEIGVQSVDSSSYVKLAADGKLWGRSDFKLRDAAPIERLHLAMCNLATATGKTLPLSASPLFFSTQALAVAQDDRARK